LWADKLQLHGRAILAHLARLDLWAFSFGVIILTGLASLGVTFARKPIRLGIPLVRAGSGTVAFVLELVLVLAYQSLYGYVYSRIAMLFALFMIGLAIGAAVTGHVNWRRSELRVLMLLQTALAVLAAATAPVLVLLSHTGSATEQLGALIVIPMINLAAGFLVGAQYPIAVAAATEGIADLTRRSRIAASLYAMDMAGACLGALVGGGVLIPVLGLPGSSMAMSVLAVAALPLLLLSERRREITPPQEDAIP